jgi:drug/metabolite transporter (DMT)-like permease
MQYVLLEILFRRLPFAAAYSFLSLANGILVALVFASLLEITYPIFIILFTAVLLRKFHLSFVGSIGAALILVGGAIVVLSRGR